MEWTTLPPVHQGYFRRRSQARHERLTIVRRVYPKPKHRFYLLEKKAGNLLKKVIHSIPVTWSLCRYYAALCRKGVFYLFSSFGKSKTGKSVLMVSTGQILPSGGGIRKKFDEDSLRSLADSIRTNGMLQPITVRKTEKGLLEVVAGERRLRAARLAGLSHVPCILVAAGPSEGAFLSLLENLQRQSLNCFEEAEGLSHLIHQWGIRPEDLSAKLGRSPSFIHGKLQLLQLSGWQRERIEACGLSERHARALLRLPDETVRNEALDCIIARQLTVAQTEQLVTKILEPKPEEPSQKRAVIRDVRLFVNTITHAVDTMRRSGLPAKAERLDTDDYIEYKIRIPKLPQPAEEPEESDSAAS